MSKKRTTDDGRRREAALWRVRDPDAAERRRPSAPSRRARRAHMPRGVFLALAVGWISAILMLLAIVLAIHWVG